MINFIGWVLKDADRLKSGETGAELAKIVNKSLGSAETADDAFLTIWPPTDQEGASRQITIGTLNGYYFICILF